MVLNWSYLQRKIFRYKLTLGIVCVSLKQYEWLKNLTTNQRAQNVLEKSVYAYIFFFILWIYGSNPKNKTYS